MSRGTGKQILSKKKKKHTLNKSWREVKEAVMQIQSEAAAVGTDTGKSMSLELEQGKEKATQQELKSKKVSEKQETLGHAGCFKDWLFFWIRADSLEKTLMFGKIEDKRRREWQRMRQLDSLRDSMDVSLSKFQEMMKDRGAWHDAVHRVTRGQT